MANEDVKRAVECSLGTAINNQDIDFLKDIQEAHDIAAFETHNSKNTQFLEAFVRKAKFVAAIYNLKTPEGI